MRVELPIPVNPILAFLRRKYYEKRYFSILNKNVDLNDQNSIVLHNNEVIRRYLKMRAVNHEYYSLIDEIRNKVKL